MSVLDDFYGTDSIRLDPVVLDVVEPPMFGVTPVGGIPAGRRTDSVACIAKPRGRLDATLVLRGFTIQFQGEFLGVDRRGRWLVRWSVNDTTPPRFMGFTVERIVGQITVAIMPLRPFRGDLTTCSDAPGEFFVTLALVPFDDMDEGFRRLPEGAPAQNEIRIWITGVTPLRALVIGVRGEAGVATPPPTPWPQPVSVNINTLCVPSARTSPNVFGHVRLDREVLRSHVGFECIVTAVGVDPPRSLTVTPRDRIGAEVYFEVALPPDLSGRVSVTAVTNDPDRAVSTEFQVGGVCVRSIWDVMYDPIRIGCEAWDCDWTGLNNQAELIGRISGLAVRYLTARSMVDPVGRILGKQAVLRAINNHGMTVGATETARGTTRGFVYGEFSSDRKSAPQMHRVRGVVTFMALNDAGVVVGGRLRNKAMTPVRWEAGKLSTIEVPAENAIALTVDGAGNIAGAYVEQGTDIVRGFVLDEQGFRDLGDLAGDVISLSMNGAGIVAGTLLSREKQQLRGFIYSPQTVVLEMEMPEEEGHCTVTGINSSSMVVGTFRSVKEHSARAFRFSMERGWEDLNNWLPPERQVSVEEAIAVNDLGQVLVVGHEKGERGHFLLNPASIPTPQVPIP